MSSDAWKKENSVLFTIRFMKNSGIPDAIKKMTEKTGEKDTAYIRRIIKEKLVSDGFLTENDE